MTWSPLVRTSSIARNHSFRLVRDLWKIVPAVGYTWCPQNWHEYAERPAIRWNRDALSDTMDTAVPPG